MILDKYRDEYEPVRNRLIVEAAHIAEATYEKGGEKWNDIFLRTLERLWAELIDQEHRKELEEIKKWNCSFG